MAPPRATPQTGRHKTTINRRPARIRRRTTRPTTCAVPAPGVINGAPTGYATNQPPQNNNQPTPRPNPPTRNATDHMCRSGTGRHEWRPTGDAANQPPQNNNQPTPRPHPSTRNATNHMCRSGTGRHKWRPHERRHKTTTAKQRSTARKRRGATCDARITDEIPRIGRRKTANARRKTTFNHRPARIRRHATRPTTCAVPAPGVMNGAPTGYAANRPTKNCKPTAANVGAPLVTPG